MEITFFDVVLDWMLENEIHAYYGDNWSSVPGEEDPAEVIEVNDSSSDWAEGDTENGFYGRTSVDIRYRNVRGFERYVEISAGSQMGSLWDYALGRVTGWKAKDAARDL